MQLRMQDRTYRGEDFAAASVKTHRMLRRNLLITLIFAVAAFLLAGLPGRSMQLTLDETALKVTRPDGRTILVDCADIARVDLVEAPDYGSRLDGAQNAACWYGEWESAAWGKYALCVHPNVGCCLAIEDIGGGISVVNGSSDAETRQIAEALRERIAGGSEK